MYYPKSQIKPNLNTNGEELVYNHNKTPYTGPYYETSVGKYYSGEGPNDPSSQLLVPINKSYGFQTPQDKDRYSISQNLENYNNPPSSDPIRVEYNLETDYLNSTKINYSKQIIAPSNQKIKPTEKDYKLGQFTRYFVRKINNAIFKELPLEIYNRYRNKDSYVQYELYIPFKITWTLTGNDKNSVANINYSILELNEQKYKLEGLVKYFNGKYSEYYK